MAVRQDYCAVGIGSVFVVGEGAFLRIDGEDIFGMQMGAGNLEISLRLYSQQDDLLLEIERNEWLSGDPLPWEIEADWQVIVLRERARQISVSLNAKTIPLEFRAEIWRHGTHVEFGKQGISISKSGHVTVKFGHLALVGGPLELDREWHPNYKKGLIVSWPNPRERLWKARDEWRKIVASRSIDGVSQ